MGYTKQGFTDGMVLKHTHLIAIEDAILDIEKNQTTNNVTNLTDKFEWTPGTCTYANGSVSQSDTNWMYSNTVDISGYKQIRFSHIQTSTSSTSLGYVFYDEKMTRISGGSNGGSNYTPINKILDVPSNAKYFRCMWINTTHNSYDSSIHDISKFYCYGGEYFGDSNSSNSTGGTTTVTPSDSTVSVPSHWKTYMETKVSEINALTESYGSLSDCFIFITDQHLSTGAGNEVSLINYIIKNTSINRVVFGGDIVQGANNDNKTFREYKSKFLSDTIILPMRGNHDVWGNGNEKNFWDIWCRPLENVKNCELTDKLWYYFDDKVRKIRYIVTDSTYASADGTNNLTSDEQIEWMKSKINELEEGWTVLVFHHGVWTASKTATMPINNDGQKMIDSIDSIYDTCKCNIAGLYVGHCHRDYNTTTDKGYLLVGTTLDCCNSGQASYDINYPTRTKGTTNEQAFDVVFFIPSEKKIKTIRIGAGANREFTYA